MSIRKATCKLSRRAGTDLQLKSGVRDITSKCNLDRLPGVHWQRRTHLSDYAEQHRMKQMIRRYYGVSEKQFRLAYKKAERQKGSTANNLMRLLESRLDNVVYRLGFASTRAEARQLVSHKSILVNGNPVNIPSAFVNLDDTIEIVGKSKGQLRIRAALERLEQRTDCEWLETDKKNMKGMFKTHPTLSDLPAEFKFSSVVELYSK